MSGYFLPFLLAILLTTTVTAGCSQGNRAMCIEAQDKPADLIVVNKCDLPGAKRLLKEVREELGPSSRPTGKRHHGRSLTATAEESAARNIETLGIEAKSGKGVDKLLEKLVQLDEAARGAEQRQGHKHRRVLGEIRRSAMLSYERTLEHRLSAPDASKLVAQLEQGEVSLDTVIKELSDLSH